MAEKRRRRGSGSLYRTADGHWEAACSLPPDPQTGKRRRLKAKGETAHEAQARLDAKKEKAITAGRMPSSRAPKFADWWEVWLEQLAPELRPATVKAYRSCGRRICSLIGAVRLDRITPAVLRDWQTKAKAQWSTRTVRIDWSLIGSCLKAAVVEGHIESSPAESMRSPRGAVGTRAAMTPDQAAMVIAAETDPMWRLQWLLAFATGMRSGERHAVRVCDVEEHGGVRGLSVRWQLQKDNGGEWPEGTPLIHVVDNWYLCPPKSKSGVRWVPLTGALEDAWDSLVRLRRAEGMKDTDLLCVRKDGGPLNVMTESRAWNAALERAGIKGHYVPHSARHTADTIMAALSIPTSTRIGIMGHHTTMMDDVYVAAIPSEMASATARTSEMLEQ